MEVKIDHITPLHICSDAIRQCWSSQNKSDTDYIKICKDCGSTDIASVSMVCNECNSENIDIEKVCGSKDRELINRIGNKYKHASTLEHISINFTIEGISRACLQEVARHRIGVSPSVKSTRYTLKELKKEVDLNELMQKSYFYLRGFDHSLDKFPEAKKVFSKYLVFTGDYLVDTNSILALVNLQKALEQGISNDKAKYCMPESYKVDLALTFNARSLQNFLSLRTNKAALWEIRDLANALYEAIPEDYKYLFKDSLYNPDLVTVTMTKEQHGMYMDQLTQKGLR